MRIRLKKTYGCFSPISLGHDPIRSLYIEIFGWALEIAIAPKMDRKPARKPGSPRYWGRDLLENPLRSPPADPKS